MAGLARSGKDTCADYIVGSANYKKYSFAEPIKLGLSGMFGWGEEELYGDLKEVDDPVLGFSPRKALQLAGTDFARKMLRDDIWLAVAEKFVTDSTVIADVRFENEAEWIRNKGGIIVHVTRPELEGREVGVSNHLSENGVQILGNDLHIINDGNLEDLYTGLYLELKDKISMKVPEWLPETFFPLN
jgi:hypothetical protein